MTRFSLGGVGIVSVLLFIPTLSAHGQLLVDDAVFQVDYFGSGYIDSTGGTQIAPILDSEWGRYEATFEPQADVGFLNIVAKIGDTEDWIVRNLPIPSLSETPDPMSVYTYFDLSALGVDRGTDLTSIDLFRDVSLAPLNTAPTAVGFDSDVSVGMFNFDVGGRADLGNHDDPGNPATDWSQLGFGSFFDLKLRPNTPNVEQGPDECGPGAATNSLGWLKNEFGVKLDDKPADRLQELAGNMDTDHNRGGTADANFIDGKLKYVADNNLDLVVKFQDDSLGAADRTVDGVTAEAKGTVPTRDWLFQEINSGEDVEIGFTYLAPEEYTDTNGNGKHDEEEPFTDSNGNGTWDVDGRANGGHWITVAGKIKIGDAWGIWYREDEKQGERYIDANDNGKWDPGEEFTDSDGDGAYDLNDNVGTDKWGFSFLQTREDGFLEVTGYSSRNKIDIIVSESIPEPAFATLGVMFCGLLMWLCHRHR